MTTMSKKTKVLAQDAHVGKYYFVNKQLPAVKLLRFADTNAIFEHGIVVPKTHKLHVIGSMTLVRKVDANKYIVDKIIDGEYVSGVNVSTSEAKPID